MSDKAFQFYTLVVPIPEHFLEKARRQSPKPTRETMIALLSEFEALHVKNGKFGIEEMANLPPPAREEFKFMTLYAATHGIDKWPIDRNGMH